MPLDNDWVEGSKNNKQKFRHENNLVDEHNVEDKNAAFLVRLLREDAEQSNLVYTSNQNVDGYDYDQYGTIVFSRSIRVGNFRTGSECGKRRPEFSDG